MHANGMRFSVFNAEGDLLATNDFYSIGGGFVINGKMAISRNPGPLPPREAQLAHEDNVPSMSTATSELAVEPVSDASLLKNHPVDVRENAFYKSIRRSEADSPRREGHAIDNDSSVAALPSKDFPMEPAQSPTEQPKQPPFPFRNMAQLLSLSRKHNLTIAQIVYENELTWYTPEEIENKIMHIWQVMDEGIRAGVLSEQETLPGSLRMKRRAPKLYARLMRGLYMGPRRLGNMGPDREGIPSRDRAPAGATELPAKVRDRQIARTPQIRGSFHHAVLPVPLRKPNFPAMDWLSCWAISTNEQVASGGRIVIAPTLGAAGIIPSVLRYVVEFVALTPEDEENLVKTFLLTAAAIGMLFKRGATISAAEGGCMAEVGTSCSMAAGAFAACMGASPEVIEQAAETAIEHNLGLTCDPVDGLVQAPCIERNAVGAVKAVVSANLALSSDGVHTITLDEAIHAARLTAADMHTKYKETSLSGLATTVKIPVAVPDC